MEQVEERKGKEMTQEEFLRRINADESDRWLVEELVLENKCVFEQRPRTGEN